MINPQYVRDFVSKAWLLALLFGLVFAVGYYLFLKAFILDYALVIGVMVLTFFLYGLIWGAFGLLYSFDINTFEAITERRVMVILFVLIVIVLISTVALYILR